MLTTVAALFVGIFLTLGFMALAISSLGLLVVGVGRLAAELERFFRKARRRQDARPHLTPQQTP